MILLYILLNQMSVFILGRRITKAEKRRQKKAKANREREARIKEERSNLKFSARNIEAEKMKKILQERSLKMHEIQPDGNWYAPWKYYPNIKLPLFFFLVQPLALSSDHRIWIQW